MQSGPESNLFPLHAGHQEMQMSWLHQLVNVARLCSKWQNDLELNALE